MNSISRFATGLIFAVAPMAGQAAIVDAGSLGADATGERTYNSTFNSVATQFFDVQAAGTLDSYTMWISLESNFLSAGENLVYVLLGKGSGTGFASVSDELARTSLSNADLISSPTITGGDGASYVAATWDLSGLGITADLGEQFGMRLFPDGSSGQVKFNGTECGSTGGLSCDPSLQLSRFQGSQSAVGTSGSVSFVGSYALTVDDGITPPDPAAVPLPAGLPLLLVGLGALGVIRKRKA